VSTYEERAAYARSMNERFEDPLTPPVVPGQTPEGTIAQAPSDFRSDAEKMQAEALLSGDFKPTDYHSGAQEGDPNFLERAKGFGSSMLKAAFDYEDTTTNLREKGVVSGLFSQGPQETVWDLAVMWPLMKMYERINQTGSYLGALAPGGIDPISYTEAGTISPGQVATLNAEVSLADTEKIANKINLGLTTLGPMGAAGTFVAFNAYRYDGKLLPDNFQNDPKQFLDKKKQKEVFEGEGAAKWVSGTYDFTWALVVDPLIIVPGGKALKFSRLRFLDEPFDADGLTRQQDALADDVLRVSQDPTILAEETGRFSQYLPAFLGGSSRLSGLGQVVRYAQQAKPTQLNELERRYGNSDLWVSINQLKNNPLYQQLDEVEQFNVSVLMMRSMGLGDSRAMRALTDAHPGITMMNNYAIAARKADTYSFNSTASAATVSRKLDQLATEISTSYNNLKRQEPGSPAYMAAEQEWLTNLRVYSTIAGDPNPALKAAQLAALPESPELALKVLGQIDEITTEGLRQIEKVAAGAEDLLRQIGTRNGAALTSEARIGRAGIGGRWNQARRLRNMDRTASVYGMSGSVSRALKAAKSNDLPIGTTGLMLRLWRLPGIERPSGTVDLRGITGADNVREITAMVFSVRAFSGATKVVDGVRRGGRERAEEIIEDWLAEAGTQEAKDAGFGMNALLDLEKVLLKEIFHYNRKDGVIETISKKAGPDSDATKSMRKVLTEADGDMAKIDEADIDKALDMFIRDANYNRQAQMKALQEGKSYWIDDQGNVHHVPALETNMAGRMYTWDFRDFENRLIRRKTTQAGADVGASLYSTFNDIWRPAVLFRLGYPIRNVGEGIIRASLYETSLAPVVDAFKAGFDGAGNLLLRRQKNLDARRESVVTDLMDDINEGLADIKHADENPYKGASREEMAQDPAFLRAVRDKGFRGWWKATLSKFSIELKRNEDMIVEAQKHYDEVVARMPEGTSLDAAATVIDDISAMPVTREGDAALPETQGELLNLSTRVRVKPTKKNPGKQVKGDPVPEGKFTDSSGYGIEEASFLPSGQVVLHRSGIPKRQTGSRPKTAIVVKTAGTLLGGEGYAFSPAKRFTITNIDEANKTIYVQISGVNGNKPIPLPIEIVTSKGSKQEIGALQEIIKKNNEEFARRQRTGQVQETIGGFSADDLPEFRTPVLDGDIDVNLVNDFANARASLELAQENLEVLRKRLRQLYEPDKAVEMYAQQKVRKNMAYQTELYQDAGASLMTQLITADKRNAFAGNSLSSVATDAASARMTTRHQLTLNSRINEYTWSRGTTTEFTKLDPRDIESGGFIGPAALGQSAEEIAKRRQEYFEGNATQLRQIYESGVGRRVMKADVETGPNGELIFTDEALEKLIAYFDTPQGRIEWKFLQGQVDDVYGKSQGQSRFGAPTISKQFGLPKSGSAQDIANREAYLNTVLGLFERLTPSGELRNMIRSGTVNPESPGFKSTVAAKNGAADEKLLTPLVGNTVTYTSGQIKKLTELYREGVQKVFEVIGSMPEDAFVRMPFYGREYRRVFDMRINRAVEKARQEGRTFLSAQEVGDIYFRSHLDSLRATKRYLYTIERRTWLGDRFERVGPFISAGQNAVQAIGRLSTRDPAAAALITFMWSRPYASGELVNDDNEVSFAFLKDMLPAGMEQYVDDMGLDLGSVNLLMPETGYGIFHRPGPVVTVPASAMMKHGFILKPYAPDLMRDVFGEEEGGALYAQFQKYLFGEMGPPNSVLRSILPATLQKGGDIALAKFFDKETKAFSYTLDNVLRTEQLKIQAGERENPGNQALYEEASNQAIGFTFVRMLFNGFAPTSPKFTNLIEPLSDEYKHYQRTYGDEGDRYFNEQYGSLLQYIGSGKGSRSVGGVDVTAESVRRASKYADLTQSLAPVLTNQPSMLGAILNDPDPDSEYVYDPSALRWQESNKIPGLSRNYREMQSPMEALNASSISAGWTEWLRFRRNLDITTEQMGLTSYRQDPQLAYAVKQKRMMMQSDPMYYGWYQDMMETGSSRFSQAIQMMMVMTGGSDAAINFQQDPENHELLNGMQEYLSYRQQVWSAANQSGSTIAANVNSELLLAFEQFVEDLNRRNPTFKAWQRRWLYGDIEQLAFPGAMLDTYSEVS